MIFQAPLSSTALSIQWYHHYQHPEESLASIPQLTLPLFLLLPFSSQPSPSAGDCQGEASGGVSAAHPGCPTCGRIPHTRTACCVAPCRHTSGWCCGSSSCGTPGSSAGWRLSRRGCTCKDALLYGNESGVTCFPALFTCVFMPSICTHGSGQIPVCVRTCLLRSNVSLKPLPQKLHRCLLVSLWHLTCLFSIRWWWKVFWQTYKSQRHHQDHFALLPHSAVLVVYGEINIKGAL